MAAIAQALLERAVEVPLCTAALTASRRAFAGRDDGAGRLAQLAAQRQLAVDLQSRFALGAGVQLLVLRAAVPGDPRQPTVVARSARAGVPDRVADI